VPIRDPFDTVMGSDAAVASRESAASAVPGRGWAAGGGIGFPRQDGGPAAGLFSRQVYPPWVYKLPESQDFSLNDYQVALAVAPGTANPASLSLTLQSGQVGWLQVFRLYILNSNATSTVGYTVRINGGPVPGLTDRRNPPGAAPLVILTSNELQIRLPEGCTLDVLFTNFAAQVEVVGAQISGWFHPLAAEIRQWGPVSR